MGDIQNGWGMGPELHHAILVHSGNSKLFSPAEQHSRHPPQPLFPSQLLWEHVAALTCESLSLWEGSGFTVDCWISEPGFICSTGRAVAPQSGELLSDECACSTPLPENTIDPPNATLPACTLHEHLAECQFQNSDLSFSMNAQVCNLAVANWIRISGGFIPSGSAWSLVFYCNDCQSWGGTEAAHSEGAFVHAFNSACLSSQGKPLLK